MNISLKRFYMLILVTSLFACKSEREKEHQNLQNDMQSYFKANMMDSTSTLDSFRLVKIDTINQRMLFYEQSSVLGKHLDNLIELYKLSNEELSNSVDKMRLYRMIESRDLVEIEKKDFDKQKEKGQQIHYEIDTLMSITKAIDSSAKNADTTKPVGFQAKCFYQLRRKDKSVERDTTFILLNINKDIIKRSDFLKLPYNVDFDKFR
ncbi:MAG: hypothetical protein ABI691_06760 [Ginsengibacter sp.]